MYEFDAIVCNVVDGDTVDALVDLGFRMYTRQRLRLAGLDTPERGQVGFQEAKQFLTDKVLNRSVVIKTTKPSKYGHYLAELYLDSVNINSLLLENGYAKPYDGGTKT